MASETQKAIYSGLYEVVDQQCTAKQIHDLLNTHKKLSEKAKKDIQVSGPKDGLIKMLIRAVSKDHVKLEAVHDLVRRCEENGQQHIFLFQPATKRAADECKDGAAIGKALFPRGLGGLPRFDRKSESVEWADFRVGTIGSRRGWLAKMYGHQRVMRLKRSRKTNESASGYTEIREYEADNFNTVHVVRWSDPDFLEIRIDSTGASNADVVPARLADVWDMISRALDPRDFVAFRLMDAMTHLAEKCAANVKQYEIGTCSVYDSKNGTIDFKPLDPGERLDGEKGRATALKDLLANGATGRRLVVKWKKCDDAPEELEQLRSEVAGEEFNELIVKAKTSAAVLDYVTNQFRAFS